jgi:hypothetical protein
MEIAREQLTCCHTAGSGAIAGAGCGLGSRRWWWRTGKTANYATDDGPRHSRGLTDD